MRSDMLVVPNDDSEVTDVPNERSCLLFSGWSSSWPTLWLKIKTLCTCIHCCSPQTSI